MQGGGATALCLFSFRLLFSFEEKSLERLNH